MFISEELVQRFGKTFKAGEIIFCEYEPGDDFFLIQSGHVKIIKIVSDKEKTLDVLVAGDIFGEMAILEQQPRSATAIAQDEVKVLNFNRQNFELLLKTNPEIAIKLLKMFARRIYEAKRQLRVLTFPEPETRVADVLILLAEKQGLLSEEASKLVITASTEDLLSLTGLNETDLNKILQSLSVQHKIEISGNKIIVSNIKEFERLIHSKQKKQNLI